MPKMTSVRLSDQEAERVQHAADAMGMKMAELLRTGGLLLSDLDPAFWKKVNNLADDLGIKPALVIQNLVLAWMARRAAFADVYGSDPRILDEFAFTSEGPLTGTSLYEGLKAEEARRLREAGANVDGPAIDDKIAGVHNTLERLIQQKELASQHDTEEAKEHVKNMERQITFNEKEIARLERIKAVQDGKLLEVSLNSLPMDVILMETRKIYQLVGTKAKKLLLK